MVSIKVKKWIWIITGLLVVLVVLFWEIKSPEKPFQVLIQSEAGTETIELWENENGVFYIFLPSYARMESVCLVTSTNTEVILNNQPVYDGVSCADFECNVPYEMEYRVFGSKQHGQVTFMRSAGIATMFLETESGDMAYIHENKENEESGSLRLYEEDGKLNCAATKLTVKGRGNASWSDYEKKPYSINLEQEADLLGMGKAQRWTLLANGADYSHMRNKIVYDFAAQIGLPYSPGCQWVSLYLNGEYSGLYLLSEKNEVHPQRVDITAENGVLVSIELADRLKAQALTYIQTDSEKALRVHYPKNPAKDTLVRMEEQWQAIENAIMSDDGIDPVSGKAFWEMADTRSWVQNYLIDELFGNLDGFKSSRYFYLGAINDQKFYAGPVWDYDKSLGNNTDPYWSITNPRVQVLNRYAYDPNSAMAWAEKLYEKTWFQDQLKKEFETEMLPAITHVLSTKITEYADLIRPAAQMDRIRWLSAEDGSFEQSVAQLADYLREHTEFLEDIWIDGNHYCQISFLKSGCDQFNTIPAGEYLHNLPVIADRETEKFVGWYYLDTNEPFDVSQPITEDIQLYAKWEKTPLKKTGQTVSLLPLGVIAVLGLVLLIVDIRKSKQSG